jgi:hypothetical protein
VFEVFFGGAGGGGKTDGMLGEWASHADLTYGPDFLDQFRRAAGYVDRILKGEKPADLPVQAATKYQLTS